MYAEWSSSVARRAHNPEGPRIQILPPPLMVSGVVQRQSSRLLTMLSGPSSRSPGGISEVRKPRGGFLHTVPQSRLWSCRAAGVLATLSRWRSRVQVPSAPRVIIDTGWYK